MFTASLSKYADKVLDELDPTRELIAHRLFRDACLPSSAGYVKDLRLLGRDMKRTLIVDNSPVCYSLQPQNAIPINSWFSDPNDEDLSELQTILEALADVEDIPEVLVSSMGSGLQ